VALIILCALAELDFVRYYTVSVFTDNLYYPLVAGAVALMWHSDRDASWRSASLAGLLGGLATLTRPSMIFVLPLVAAWFFTTRGQRGDRRRSAALVLSTVWMLVVFLATLRNWLVSGRFVLLAESSLQILFFLAPPDINYTEYMRGPRPSVFETLLGAIKMFFDHPVGVILVEGRKLAFMVGFTNIMPGFRLHPEFLALSTGYLAWWRLMSEHAAKTAVVHFTLLGHVIAFLIASPMSYGYKTILTLMMLVVPFVAILLWTGYSTSFGRIGKRLGQAV
jgi:hypothetical protein